MISSKDSMILKEMLEGLELPQTAYEKAKGRYDDLGEWFSRRESSVAQHDPHIYPQGSFRLGTAIRPLMEGETYDLDLGCKLRQGISTETHTQEELKNLVGAELESYRQARGIQTKIKPKHRCWRLEYRDVMNFHMDVVPSIPAKIETTRRITERLMKSGLEEALAASETATTSVITDDRSPSFKTISDEWKISNPEGYAKWFERRALHIEGRIELLEKAQVDDLPLFQRKTSLQQVIQLLKRHRDQMFKNDSELKPISIIITTLAAHAYNGELDLSQALLNILGAMESFVRPQSPRVPNPVDPEEDFADKWQDSKYRDLNLEGNFQIWLKQAKIDFKAIFESDSVDFVKASSQQRLAVALNEDNLAKLLGPRRPSPSPKVQVIANPAQPWSPERRET
jgi:hypothetical protein